jgi:hypothetical protein
VDEKKVENMAGDTGLENENQKKSPSDLPSPSLHCRAPPDFQFTPTPSHSGSLMQRSVVNSPNKIEIKVKIK